MAILVYQKPGKSLMSNENHDEVRRSGRTANVVHSHGVEGVKQLKFYCLSICHISHTNHDQPKIYFFILISFFRSQQVQQADRYYRTFAQVWIKHGVHQRNRWFYPHHHHRRVANFAHGMHFKFKAVRIHHPLFFNLVGELSQACPCDPLPRSLLVVLFDRFLGTFKQGARLGFVDTNPTYAVRVFLEKKFKITVFYDSAQCLTSAYGSAEASSLSKFVAQDLEEWWHSLRNKGTFYGIPAKEKASYWVQIPLIFIVGHQ